MTSVGLASQDTTDNYTLVKFNLSWSNSWRVTAAPANWDAAWVFVKFRVGLNDATFTGVSSSGTTVTVGSTANLRVGMPVVKTAGTGTLAANTTIASIVNSTQITLSGTPSVALNNATIVCRRIWEHAWLNDTGHTAPSGSTIDAGLLTPGDTFNASTNPAVGVFVYRSATGTGTNTFNNVQLRWNYGAHGIADDAFVQIRVFALEMVYVPAGAFYVGGGATDQGGFKDGTTANAFQVTAAWNGTNASGGRKIGNVDGQLWAADSPNSNNDIGVASTTTPLDDDYPTGYDGFYCMKYELSQGMFRDFLNTLTRLQQATLVTRVTEAVGTQVHSGFAVSLRLTIEISSSGVEATEIPAQYGNDASGNGVFDETNDGEWVPMNGIYWPDISAFIDWAALRPMTELEFEKACRGNQNAVTDEYAWGNTTLTSALWANRSNVNQANEGNTTTNGNAFVNGQPQRSGLSAGAATTRVQAGAGYYGALSLSSNLYEPVINISNAAGRAYTGMHGDGMLTTTGTSNVTAWPGGAGIGARGGGHSDGFGCVTCRSRVADRSFANSGMLDATNRKNINGIRAVRSLP